MHMAHRPHTGATLDHPITGVPGRGVNTCRNDLSDSNPAELER